MPEEKKNLKLLKQQRKIAGRWAYTLIKKRGGKSKKVRNKDALRVFHKKNKRQGGGRRRERGGGGE